MNLNVESEILYKYTFLLSLVYNLNIQAVSSAVEHLPYKQMVTGSNPVPPIQQIITNGLIV